MSGRVRMGGIGDGNGNGNGDANGNGDGNENREQRTGEWLQSMEKGGRPDVVLGYAAASAGGQPQPSV